VKENKHLPFLPGSFEKGVLSLHPANSSDAERWAML